MSYVFGGITRWELLTFSVFFNQFYKIAVTVRTFGKRYYICK